MEISAVLASIPEGGYDAYNPEAGKAARDEGTEEAVLNPREPTVLYWEEFPLAIVGRPPRTAFQIPDIA